MKPTIIALAFALLVTSCERAVVVAPPAEQKAVAELAWLTNFDAARAKARAENKLLLIDFTGSDWCPPCKMLKREVFSQPEFAEYAAEKLVLLEVDFPREKAQSEEQKEANRILAQQFRIQGFPTIVVLSPSGKILGELGYMRGGPRAFIAELEKLRS